MPKLKTERLETRRFQPYAEVGLRVRRSVFFGADVK